MFVRGAIIVSLPALLLGLLGPGLSSAQVVATYQVGLSSAWGLVFDPAGNLYVSGFSATAGVVRRVPAGGGSVTTFAIGFSYPTGMALSPSGDLYVADLGPFDGAGPGRIWKVTPAGARSVFADGFAQPNFLEFDAAGNLVVSERTGRRLKRISPTGVVSDYGPVLGGTAEFAGQFVIDPSGDVYIGVGPYIMRVGPGGSPVTIFASGLDAVSGLARGSLGEFHVSRFGHRDLWRVSPSGAASHWAGSTPGCVDGLLTEAKFGGPMGLGMYKSRLFIADRECHTVRTIEAPTPASRGTWGRMKAAYR